MRDSLVPEMLRALRADLAEILTERREQRGRLGAIERLPAHLARESADQHTETGGWFDRRLDLTYA